MNPLVSIITPSFNQAAYLEDTLRSVLAQDYAPLEYLVVDGASTDGSVEIIQRYADRLSWWVSEPDAGQAEAINKGLRRAKGEIVAWLNSDDIYLPGAVSRAVASMQESPTLGLIFGDALTIDSAGRPLNRQRFGNWGLEDLMSFRIICQPAVFMRRQALEKAGYLDPSYHFMLDHNLWLRIALLSSVQPLDSGVDFVPLAAARHHLAAKNVSQAERFGAETLQLLAWMQNQPEIASRAAHISRRTMGGAYRLNARYLLDGGLARQALQSYALALRYWPSFALKHWHRMLYAVLCLAGLKAPLERQRTGLIHRQSAGLVNELLHGPLNQEAKLETWPGLSLHT